ncbi:hypothetical protein V6N12_005450 [Hibiscus sabdariffa]|uniref:Uncharacterized protein n=1 Tax=Hibiscus sabdariffa TaxID=183260 RepID=A0ABR2A2S1_9ROSI
MVEVKRVMFGQEYSLLAILSVECTFLLITATALRQPSRVNLKWKCISEGCKVCASQFFNPMCSKGCGSPG